MLAQAAQTALAPHIGLEFFVARRLQNGAAALEDAAHFDAGEKVEVAGNQAAVSLPDAVDLDAIFHACSHDSADRGVHAWRVATAGHNRDTFHANAIAPDTVCKP